MNAHTLAWIAAIDPLAIAFGIAGTRWAIRVGRLLDQLSDAIIPKDGPSLRRVVTDVEKRVTVLETVTQ